MVKNPDIQKKVQHQIDAVIGQGRLPTFSDRDHLPYIDAILFETLRLRPPVPLGIPHATTEDDHFKGYYIPKGQHFHSSGNIYNVMSLYRDTCVCKCSVRYFFIHGHY